MQKNIRWLPWEPGTFQRAKQEQKPTLLVIGFPSCHWCHVLEKESFMDEEIILLLNEYFICVHVDREQRPDVDTVYMAACQAMTGRGGWPLVALLDMSQQPFYISTYITKSEMLSLLTETIEHWSKYRDRFTNMGEQLTKAIRDQFTVSASPVDIEQCHVEQAIRAHASVFDPHWGGVGITTKFPMPHVLSFLLRQYAMAKDHKALHMAELTLLRMCEGAIFDHVGGGFMRYATDRQWAIPHFEKMLDDNAMLIQAYIEAWQITGKSIYRNVAERTLSYVLREMVSPEGGIYSSQDADAMGVEGVYYHFEAKEILSILGKEDGEAYINYYALKPSGLPNRIGHNGSIETLRMSALNEIVYSYRRDRMPLATDEKILTSWNALMIQSFVQAYLAFDEQKYLDTAIKAASFLQKKLTQPDGSLMVHWRNGEASGVGTLDDYANTIMAALSLYRATLEDQWLSLSVSLSRMMLERFEDRDHGGFFMTSSKAEKLIARPKETYDGAHPSGNAAALSVLVSLSMLDIGEGWSKAAERQTAFLSGFVAEDPLHHTASLLAAMPYLYPITMLDAQADVEENKKLLSALRGQYLPALYLKATPKGTHGNNWRLCKGTTCLAPFQEMEALLSALS